MMKGFFSFFGWENERKLISLVNGVLCTLYTMAMEIISVMMKYAFKWAPQIVISQINSTTA